MLLFILDLWRNKKFYKVLTEGKAWCQGSDPRITSGNRSGSGASAVTTTGSSGAGGGDLDGESIGRGVNSVSIGSESGNSAVDDAEVVVGNKLLGVELGVDVEVNGSDGVGGAAAR